MKEIRNVFDPTKKISDLRTALVGIVSDFEYEVDGKCGVTNKDLPAIKHRIWDKAYGASSAIIELNNTISDLMYILQPLCPEEEIDDWSAELGEIGLAYQTQHPASEEGQ